MSRVTNSLIIGRNRNPKVRFHGEHRSKKGRKRTYDKSMKQKRMLREEGKLI